MAVDRRPADAPDRPAPRRLGQPGPMGRRAARPQRRRRGPHPRHGRPGPPRRNPRVDPQRRVRRPRCCPVGRAGARAHPRPRAHLTGRPSPRRARRPASQPLRHGRRDQDRTALPQAPGHGPAHLGAGAAGRPEPDVDPAGPHPSRRPLSRRPGHLRPAPHRPRRGSGLPGPAALLAHQPRADHRLERRRPTRQTGPHPQSVRRAHPRIGLHLARADRAHQRPRPVRRAGHHPRSGRTGDDRPSPDGRRRLGRAVHRPGHRQ